MLQKNPTEIDIHLKREAKVMKVKQMMSWLIFLLSVMAF